MKQLAGLLKTHDCGKLTKEHIGQTVTVCGWVNKYRDLGGLHFLDVRDKYGVLQLGFEKFKGDISVLKTFSLESVVKATGIICARPDSAKNKDMKTGDIEVQVESIELLSYADNVPFLPYGLTEATEDLRLKYRYIDLRTQKLQDILTLRSETTAKFRQSLTELGFTEVETPILYKSTPEGARDYIVPSRVHPGKVYALPQSPQTLKQLLMIAGTDKYFQITRCFRDEDLRADRQPEFTQVDIEVSYCSAEYIKNLAEHMMKKVFGLTENFSITKISYQEAMDKYGSDKPDLRYGLEQINVNSAFKNSDFAVFKTILESNGLIKAMFVPEDMGQLARKQIDALTDVVKPHGGKGVAWFKVKDSSVSGGISKFITPEILSELNQGDGLWLFCASDDHDVSHACADAVRRHLAKELNLIDPDALSFLWIDQFPLLEYDKEEGRFYAKHHPFTMPFKEDIEGFMKGSKEDLINCRADAYDLVLNGYEIGGGSLRIFDQNIQRQMFNVLGMSEEEYTKQFGFFIEALKYGTPPHGGIALGLDRVTMLLAKTDSIRDVIAFPKTTSATDLMAQCPSSPAKAQTDELNFSWIKKP